MTTAGWIFMCGSVSAVVALTCFCYWKALVQSGSEKKMHAPLDIDTDD